jgi:hypothetical protein
MRKFATSLSIALSLTFLASGAAAPAALGPSGFSLGSLIHPADRSGLALGAFTSGSASRTAAPGAITFFPNQELPCDLAISGAIGCGQILEPEVKTAPNGTIWVTAQEGAGGGINAWFRDPKTFVYHQIKKVDGLPAGTTDLTGVSPGGGDNELSITSDGGVQISTLNSLVTIGMATSDDDGETWQYNAAASNFSGVDRQWQATVGPDTVYLAYHDIVATQIWLVKSTDGGNNFGAPLAMLPAELAGQWASSPAPDVAAGNIHSNMVSDRDGRVAMSLIMPGSATANATPAHTKNSVWVVITDPDGGNPAMHQVYLGPDDANYQGLFPAIASDKAGNLYVSWSDLKGVYLSVSRDHAATWSPPVKISKPASTSAVFPFVIAGDAGRVALAWLGSNGVDPDDPKADWYTYFSYNMNALAKGSKWTEVVASDHISHKGQICLHGLECDVTGGNRNLAEVLQIGLTKDGRALIAYPDDSNTVHIAGWSWIAEQATGPGFYARVKPNPPKLPKPAAVHGGVIASKLRKTGKATQYFTAGEAGSGLQNPDPAGGELDAPGDAGAMSTKPGDSLHVASGNLWTTTFGGLPVAFDAAPLKKDTIYGGTISVTAFTQEPMAVAYVGGLSANLVDVAADGKKTLIAGGGDGYPGGVDIIEKTYVFSPSKPYEVLKGHHLRVEVSFTCFCSTDLRFYYGNADYPARIVADTFVRA